jgi:hypothetical protein
MRCADCLCELPADVPAFRAIEPDPDDGRMGAARVAIVCADCSVGYDDAVPLESWERDA